MMMKRMFRLSRRNVRKMRKGTRPKAKTKVVRQRFINSLRKGNDDVGLLEDQSEHSDKSFAVAERDEAHASGDAHRAIERYMDEKALKKAIHDDFA